jgi:hypothetical protein
LIPPILDWVSDFISCINTATESISSYKITIKDLRATINLELIEPFTDVDKTHFITILRQFADINSCKYKEAKFNNTQADLLLLLKYPHGPSQKNNPFLTKKEVILRTNNDRYTKRRL